MRDASRIRERRENSSSRGPIVWSALGAVMVLVLTFSLGMIVGKRTAASATPNPDGITLADIEEAKDLREDLKFYRSLTEAAKPTPAAQVTAPAKPVAAAAKPAQPTPEPGRTMGPELKAEVAPKPAAEAQSIQSALSRLAKPTASGAQEAGRYTVQVSSFPSLEEAEAYQSSLVRKGYSPYIVSANLPGRGTWFRVRMGHYDEKNKALDAKDSLARANIPGWVLAID